MTPQNNFDLSGEFRVHPFAELLVEIMEARLTGALRLDSLKKKSIIYFRDGAVVFAVSNAPEHRLFARLLNIGRISQADIKNAGNPSNDMEFAAVLCKSGLMNKESVSEAFVSQIGAIIIDALTWTEGRWEFSTHSRLRTDVFFEIEIHRLLMDYARCVPVQTVMSRFKSVQEKFVRSLAMPNDAYLQPQEACVLELFDTRPLDFAQIRALTSTPESVLDHSLYVLWLGGALVRLGWNRAFSENRIADIKKTLFSRVKEAPPLASFSIGESATPSPTSSIETEPLDIAVPAVEVPALTLDEWLMRAENSETHYDILAVADNAGNDVIKAAYFALAKLFHPDRYHRETGPQLRRIQVAFTELAHAYETLKTQESRKSYDYKIRKELETREKRKAAGVEESADGMQAEHALESFEQGLIHLNEEEYEAAAAYLVRAVHYNPKNALYRAYYGSALSRNDAQLHKAEFELQAAARLEPQNSKIRLMLATFFINRGMKKRAEGELTRFLEIAPDNAEARRLLDGLQRQV